MTHFLKAHDVPNWATILMFSMSWACYLAAHLSVTYARGLVERMHDEEGV